MILLLAELGDLALGDVIVLNWTPSTVQVVQARVRWQVAQVEDAAFATGAAILNAVRYEHHLPDPGRTD